MSETIRPSFNSSITRVRPVFERLIRQDGTGRSWLQKVLRLASRNQSFATSLAADTGDLLPWVSERRRFDDRVLKSRGVAALYLEHCFEHDLAPPVDFLRWLIQTDRMTWPDRRSVKFGTTTQRFREDLFGRNGPDAGRRAQLEALGELERVGAKGSRRRWWAFEGFTSADCYLETDKLVLLIEGKRFESVSSAVQWYPSRNQLIRNLEATCQAAAGKGFAVLAIGEGIIDEVGSDTLVASLPHFTADQRDELWSHYLGSTTWAVVCQATGIDYTQLPDTVDDAVDDLREFGNLTV